MERSLISWSVPNMITIWLMLFIGFLVLAVAMQFGLKWAGKSGQSQVANNSSGY